MSATAKLTETDSLRLVAPSLENDEQTMLGSYSYNNNKENKFQYTTAGLAPQTFYFKIVPVNNNVAAVQFHQDQHFNQQIAIPGGITMHDLGAGAAINPFMNCFFITWAADSLELRSNGLPIFKLTNQKQQSLSVGTRGLNVQQIP